MKKTTIAIGLGLLVATISFGQTAPAMTDKAQRVAGERTYFLFVQTADAGTFSPINGKPGRYELVLEGAGSQTLYFSDRPARISGTAPTEKFLQGLGFSESNPPNAAIEVVKPDNSTELIVVELRSPHYDAQAGRLTYEVAILKDAGTGGLAQYGNRLSTTLPPKFRNVALFIDDCPDTTFYCNQRWNSGDGTGNCNSGAQCGVLGKWGTCYDWGEIKCNICHPTDWSSLCNQKYPNCCNAADCKCSGDE